MNDIFSDLRSIGIFFSRSHFSFHKKILTPEDALISALSILKSDYLVLQLVHTWMQKNHLLIHAEAFLKKIELQNIEPVDLAFLGGLLASTEDRRLMSIASKIPKSKTDLSVYVSKPLKLAGEMGQVPYDKNFLLFGLKINQLELEDSKKFIPQEIVLKQNPFLYCRTLFGTNWRADVAALLMLKPEATPTEVSALLGCSYETSHRNVHSLRMANWSDLAKCPETQL